MRFLFTRCDRGFSLAETLITCGILGGLALVGTQIFKNQSKSQKQIESSYEIVNILQAQRQTLSSVQNCTETFRGQNPQGGAKDRLRRFRTQPSPGFDDVYVVGQEIQNHIKVLSYTLAKNDIPPATLETFLKITYSRGKSAISETSTKLLRLGYTLSGSNIDTCWVLHSDVNTFWLQSSIDPNDIYYSGGQVGIGTGMTDPQHALDVTGTFRFGTGTDTLTGSGLSLTGSGTLVIAPGLTVNGNISSTGTVAGDSANFSGIISGDTGNFSSAVNSPTFFATTSMRSPSFQYMSDRALKKNIRGVTNALDRVDRLRGVEFSWKSTGESDLGFIAQEVEPTEPALVGIQIDGLRSVKYGNVTALLVEAVKELRREIEVLRRKNDLLEKKLKERSK